ncbi:flagellar hook-associated protein 2 [Evansella vedderi]|uniref:Flagellar hook-associated protein 2 n=1 Tax=Evansella vedderi TaxID=38282 RepID=A0ABT9ZTG8_9BACI|nr:flagellar hook-associated protein 2 [Evansella vedderi]MDQ0254537.1 flagellar hook-associated protein 2 [Evansella vedderi]
MRIGGLATGMDTENMIKQLMQAERMPVNKMIQDRTWMEWQRDALREINLQLSSFRESFRASGLGLRSNFNQKIVTSSDPTKVTATGTSSAQNATARIEVTTLAEASTWKSSGFDIDNEFFTRRIGNWEDGPDIPWENDRATLKFEVVKPGATEPTTVEVQINKTDRMNDVINRMNRSQLGVSSFIDDRNGNGTMILSMNDTGKGSDIRFVDETTKNFFSSLGFETGENNSINGEHQTNAGQNAHFTFNGHNMERESNEFTINGVRYQLHGVTNGTVRINTTTDTDAIFDRIMKFVEDYNAIVDKINGVLREERHRGYPPLTEEQRGEMSEREIELWEEKARSGLLRSDQQLTSALNQMRTELFSNVEGLDGVFKNLNEIGLTTSRDFRDGGKIVLDDRQVTMPDGTRMTGEERLRAAIENNPEDLFQLFNATGGRDENGRVIRSEQGILERLNTQLRSTIDNITARAGREGRTLQQFSIGRNILSVEDRISNFERRLQQTEQRYWAQFTAMEKAMAQMNAQADQMWSMMMGMMN